LWLLERWLCKLGVLTSVIFGGPTLNALWAGACAGLNEKLLADEGFTGCVVDLDQRKGDPFSIRSVDSAECA